MALGVDGVRVGCWTDREARTGCTVVLPPDGTLGAVSVRGGAPGSRELGPLLPSSSGEICHAVVLCGNSVFGLIAAEGVQRWCEENDIGLDLDVARVPIVPAAVVFDLRDGDRARPTMESGRAACDAATTDDPPMGNVGVGTGCTVGKRAGRDHRVNGGQGWAVARSGDLVVGALMAVNAVGDILDEQRNVLAGDTAPANALRYPAASMEQIAGASGIDSEAAKHQNTVIGALVTNASMTKAEASRAVDLAHAGITRTVYPAHTAHDGDTLFLLCTGAVDASIDLVADLGAQAVEEAIRAAVRHADSP